MNAANEREFPVVVLLLNAVRRVSEREARRVVACELGDEVARTVRVVSENAVGMSYLDWKVGPTPYHLGTSSEPYLNVIGVSKVDHENRQVGPTKWTIREELPPEDPACCEAWMSHSAWLYVDALLFHCEPHDDDLHLRNVLKIASHFVDERCVLVWRYGGEPKRVALPTPQTLAALRAGQWPG